MASEICSRAQRHRSGLARPEAASPRPSDVQGTGRPRSRHPSGRHEAQHRTKPPSVGQPPKSCLALDETPNRTGLMGSSNRGSLCKALLNRNQHVCWSDGACEAELGDLECEAAGLGFGRGASKVVWAEILIEGAVAKHVIGGGQDGSCYGADGLLGSAAVAQALELSLKVAALFACAGPGALHQRGLEPRRALAQPGGAALAGALVVAGTEPGPGDQVAGGREAAHVDADLGDDDLRGQVTDAGDGAQQPDRLTERVEIAVHLLVDLGDGGLQGIDLTQVQAQQEAVALGDAAGQGGPQLLGRGLDAALHEAE